MFIILKLRQLKKKYVYVTLLILVLLISIPIEITIHEFGHVLPFISKGGEVKKLVVMSHQIYPDFLAIDDSPERTSYSYATWPPEYDVKEYDIGLSEFLGSGFPMAISIFSILLLWTFKPKGIVRIILTVASLFVLDILTYSLLPQMGMPHRLIAGSLYAEPIEGLCKMGIPKVFALSVLTIVSFAVIGMLYFFIKKQWLIKSGESNV